MYKNSDGPIPRRISTESIDVGGEGGEEGQGMKTRDNKREPTMYTTTTTTTTTTKTLTDRSV